MIRAAPHTVTSVALAVALLTGTGAFIYQEHHYSERFATFEANEKYLNRQLTDYKQAFPGKSPDEAAKEVAALRTNLEKTEKHLDSLEKAVSLAELEHKREISSIQENIREAERFKPWRLTAEQKNSLDHILDEPRDKFSIRFGCLSGSAQSQSFTIDLIEVFRRKGWETAGSCFFNALRPDLVGVIVGVPYYSMQNFGEMPH